MLRTESKGWIVGAGILKKDTGATEGQISPGLSLSICEIDIVLVT